MEKIAFNQEKFRVKNLDTPWEGNDEIGATERMVSALAGILLVKQTFKKGSLHPIKLLFGSYLVYRGLSGKCLLFRQGRQSAVNARATITVDRPREEVYAFWRAEQNLPLFMSPHIRKVEQQTDTRFRWTMSLPGGLGDVSWDSLIVKDEPGELIGWHSEKMTLFENSGKVEFVDTPDGQGTLVNLVVSYHPPANELGRRIASLFTAAFESMLEQNLKKFKELMEPDLNI